MLSFVLCDDNLSILNRLSKMLDSLFIEHNYDAQVTFQSNDPKEIIKFLKNNTVNVLILDINLNSTITGIELAQRVRSYNKDIYFIFTTAHLEYALIAYKVKTFDYLAKPITKQRLEETIVRLFTDMSNNMNTYIKIDNKNTLISQNNIKYIRKDGMKLVFHTDTKEYVTYNSFKNIQDCLPDNFVRCHKSYIANVNRITDVESNHTIFFNDKDKCFIGNKYKNNFMEVLNHGNFSDNMGVFDNT